MDGYAVRAAELAGADRERPVELPVAADIPAGRTDVPALTSRHRAPDHDRGTAAGRGRRGRAGRADRRRHRAGPAGTPPRPSGRTSGASARTSVAGPVVLAAGTVLGPAQIGLAAAVGSATLPVRRRPVVLVLSTGSELVEPGYAAAARPDLRVERPDAAAAVEDAGGRAELLRFVPDDVAEFLGRLRERLAAGDVDLVLTSGGVSAGRLRGGQGRVHRPRGGVRQGRHAAGRAAGRRPGRRARGRRGGDAARQPGELAGVVRGVRPAGAAGRAGPPAAATGRWSPPGWRERVDLARRTPAVPARPCWTRCAAPCARSAARRRICWPRWPARTAWWWSPRRSPSWPPVHAVQVWLLDG